MMGLPDGWITDTPGVTWAEAVKMCGNGVVPQQAAAAVGWLLDVMSRFGNDGPVSVDTAANLGIR